MTSTDIRPAPFAWTDDDAQAVTTARVLAMDAVEEAGHGHPGTAVSLAPAAHLIFQRFLRHDPADPAWPGRDRFVLSCGHSSLTLYIQLHLTGYPVSLDDLRAYRKRGSLTPAHPERGLTPGVETTTGPLGQGIATAVGMAMGARRERGLFDPGAPAGTSPFDHRVFVLCSDGDIQEGVSSEAGAFAGHQRLGGLVVVYDDNRISIEGSTDLATSEDVAARYAAYGWHVQRVALAADGDIDLPGLSRALEEATAETDRPSIILMRSTIAWPVPGAQNTPASHGSALGAEAVRAAKAVLGADPDATFDVPEEVRGRTTAAARAAGARAHRAWDERFAAWAAGRPDGLALWRRLESGRMPAGFEDARPSFGAGTPVATRKAFGRALKTAAARLPELWGGSADLGESNHTTVDATSSFLPASNSQPGADPAGRTIHWGIREHFMAAAMNGIALSGRSRPYGGTFLVFSDYMRPAVRLAALMRLPVVYVWTHDSIGLGEDGPTHQPVEHLASLRAIPGLDVVRPADANETALTLWKVLTAPARPTGFSLSRQDLPVFPDHGDGYRTVAGAVRGGYIRYEPRAQDPGAEPDAVIIATGSEVHVAITAARSLADEAIRARVVSMPCREWFDEQPSSYRDSVIPPTVRARVTVEAGVSQGWHDLLGLDGRAISVQTFGASAPAGELFEHFGITPEGIATAVRAVVREAAPGR
ncbi:transketolase [Actinacidiphila sp. ITFR-21]|uniref:transketolase n=1 Tax=Actinacidiphila sp. ITFR-21 TaxID=3075199 RepID=UPI0028893B59|nr:transketolase [Streptomyces sp. ITFR-21]WNI14250.1 transketolase [Streptomyces sp. ITFR-21]